MTTFDLLKVKFITDPNNKNFGLINLVLGGTAGAVATALTYPTDLLRRKMQLIVLSTQAFNQNQEFPYKTILQCIKWIYVNEGFTGFYKGFVPCFAKVIPAIGVAFAVNEELKKLLKLSK
jgi:Mitochondrial carrier protein